MIDNTNSSVSDKNQNRLTFLDSIARAYIENFSDLSEFTFVFPNKRSGTFFLRSLRENLNNGRTILAPEVVSIADFVEELSQRESASRIDLLFRLYNLYKEIKAEEHDNPEDSSVMDFDSFRSWGEILISDFSEVDQYHVDADALFANVSDFREIASNFLTDEQLDILERYFGYTPNRRNVENFWKNLVPPDNRSDLKNQFVNLWQLMLPLYHALQENLERDGLAMTGTLYRLALNRVKAEGKDAFLSKKIIFVGFNALSTTEALLFEEIRKAGGFYENERDSFADFFWDGTGPVLESEESDAASFLRLNRKNFPSPQWAKPYLDQNRVDKMPQEIKVIASPSNSAQAKLAGSALDQLIKTIGTKNITDAKVAVVLPDENLLLPLLYALPEGLEAVNLTMGYSLRTTSVASFLHHLRTLHSRSRLTAGAQSFYHEDLKLFLSHPFTHSLLGSRTVSALNAYMLRHHKFMVSLNEISDIIAKYSKHGTGVEVFDISQYGDGMEGGIRYIDDVLARVDFSLGYYEGGVVKSRIDRSHIAVYREALKRLELSTSDYGIEMGLQGVFYMVDKLLAGEHVTFEGEPLEGLQVMGLLETRALDFDHLIITSLNDRIMPRKARKASFIPDSLRSGYGLPYSNYQESLFAYYFYRMISRAKTVTLIYDARSGEGMRSGGESRYLMQLRYLYARGGIKFENYRFMLSEEQTLPQPVKKNREIMNMIEEFAKEGSNRNFSASVLRKYGECQVKFYYEVIRNISADSEDDEFIDAITQGNIVHDVMLNLYFPQSDRRHYLENKIVITADTLDNLLNDKKRIRRELRRSINTLHFHKPETELDTPIEGASAMVAYHLEHQIREIISYDRSLAPFSLAGGEMTGLVRWQFDAGRKVNMKYAIDRLDIQDIHKEARWRIVDYKTGDPYISATEFEDIFNGTLSAKNLFQLLLYANLMNLDLKMDKDVSLAIYPVNKLLSNGEVIPEVGDTQITGHKMINEEFTNQLNKMLKDIFDISVPFRPTEDESHCRYCHLHALCGKQ